MNGRDELADKEAWRNTLRARECRTCAGTFQGKYNSRTCSNCKEANRAKANQSFRARRPHYWRDWQRRTNATRMPHLVKYGLTVDDYEALAESQGGRCAICRESPDWKANGGRLVVDHDHTTGAVRGLLCPSCNLGLGYFADSPKSLTNAINYLGVPR